MISSRFSQMTTVGVAGIGYYIPAGTITSREMAERSGILEDVFREKIGVGEKHLAAADEHPAGMGVQAAVAALQNAGTDPSEIDIIAYCGLGYYDYQFWSPAAKVQDGIGAHRSYAFEIRNGCNGGNLGLSICKELILGNPAHKCALVVCSDKLSLAVNYTDKSAISSFSFADGAVAVVLKKDIPNNRLCAYASLTDGTLADYVKVPYGGTKYPVTTFPVRDDDRYLCVTDPGGLDEIFASTYLQNYLKVIHEALDKSGYSVKDIDHIFTNQVKRSLSEKILEQLGLTKDQTLITMGEYGHMGPVDTLFGLGLALEKNRIRAGDIVVLAGSAIGFSWAAIVLEF
jgi:3-oxoacyl-[acyl-carrier-protein] synthase-3